MIGLRPDAPLCKRDATFLESCDAYRIPERTTKALQAVPRLKILDLSVSCPTRKVIPVISETTLRGGDPPRNHNPRMVCPAALKPRKPFTGGGLAPWPVC